MLIVGDLVVDDRVKVGDRCIIGEEHVDVGMVALFVFFALCAYAVVDDIEFRDWAGRTQSHSLWYCNDLSKSPML